jgi:hypothetical protein
MLRLGLYAVAFLLVVFVITLVKRRLLKQTEGFIQINPQGMVKISVAALTATPLNRNDRIGLPPFPHDYYGFLAELSPMEINTILLESATGTYTERKKDIARVVTIAAAIYGFKIPLRLVCLDDRTHALYAAVAGELELVPIRVANQGEDTLLSCLIRRDNAPEPDSHYLSAMTLVGHILMHYAMKNNYPSFRNFVKTFVKNLKARDRMYTEYEIGSIATAYAATTGIKLPSAYVVYNSLAEDLMNSKAREQMEPVKLRLVKT